MQNGKVFVSLRKQELRRQVSDQGLPYFEIKDYLFLRLDFLHTIFTHQLSVISNGRLLILA